MYTETPTICCYVHSFSQILTQIIPSHPFLLKVWSQIFSNTLGLKVTRAQQVMSGQDLEGATNLA